MRKKFHLFELAVILAFIGLAIANSSAEYVCGDANSDGALNVSDAVYVINYVFIGGPAPDPDCCEKFEIGTVTDIDGNLYFTIQIGDQYWMMENLRVTHYRNGEEIPNITDAFEWSGLSTGAYCNYDNDDANVNTYGRLYNFYAVDDSRGIAPEGWHVPSDNEWKQLEMYLGMSQAEADAGGWRGTDEGGKLKEAGTTYWQSPNTGATNETGFTALPHGYRSLSGNFGNMGSTGGFWSSTEVINNSATIRTLSYSYSTINRGSGVRTSGIPIRCVKD